MKGRGYNGDEGIAGTDGVLEFDNIKHGVYICN